MAIEKWKLECFPKYLHMGTGTMNQDKDTKEEKQKRVKMERIKGGTK